MKKLLLYLQEYKKETLISPLFKMLEAILELLVPLIVASMIDRGIVEKNTPYVLQMGALLLGCGIAGLAVSLIAQYYAAKAAVGFGKKLRQSLFSHVQRFSYTQLDQVGIPMLMSRMTTDVNQAQTGVNMTLRLLLRSPFVVFGAMIMAFTVDAEIAFIFVALIALLGLVVWLLMSLTIPGHKQVQGKLEQVLLHTRENLTGVRVIRAFAKEESERSSFVQEHERFTKLQTQVGAISALMNPLTYTLVNGALVGLLFCGALEVQEGQLTQGAVVALMNYLLQILVELVKMANLILTMAKAMASAGRIAQVLDITPEEGEQGQSVKKEAKPARLIGESDISEAQPGSVSFEQVSMWYRGAGEKTLSNISFAVLPGQTVGVIGATGSGKSTLVHLIPRFYEATEGIVRVDGMDVRECNLTELRKKIAMVPQKTTLFRGTIRENLRWGNENATDEALWEALTIAQAAEIVRGKAMGLDERIEQNGRNVSGGQRQRLTIARALVKKPEILILDDSSSALDYATDAALRKALRALQGTMTVIMVSQRIASVRFADLILVLHDGELVGSGTHEELLKSCPVYQEINASQNPKGGAA